MLSTRTKGLMIAACLLAAVLCLPALRWLPAKQCLNALAAEIESWGIWGPVVLVVVYLVTTLLLLPAWVFTVLAGFLFGVVEGTLAASLANVASAGVAFLLGRTVASDWVHRKLGQSPRFQALDAAIESQGFKLVVLIRLSPVFPFALTNYALSLTKIRFRDFLPASAIGMLPLTMLYVYLGSTAQSIADVTAGNYRRSSAQTLLFGVGLVTTIVLAIIATRSARSAMRKATDAE